MVVILFAIKDLIKTITLHWKIAEKHFENDVELSYIGTHSIVLAPCIVIRESDECFKIFETSDGLEITLKPNCKKRSAVIVAESLRLSPSETIKHVIVGDSKTGIITCFKKRGKSRRKRKVMQSLDRLVNTIEDLYYIALGFLQVAHGTLFPSVNILSVGMGVSSLRKELETLDTDKVRNVVDEVLENGMSYIPPYVVLMTKDELWMILEE